MPELSQTNLAYHNASQKGSHEAAIKQTVKHFHEENDQYRRFLVTGLPFHQREAQAKDENGNKFHTGTSVLRRRIITSKLY